MRMTYKYRLFPTDAQHQALEAQLGEACRLYNAALQERRDAYQKSGMSLNYYDQANQLKAIRQGGSIDLANYSACQDILRRVDKTFQAFFRRIKAGQRAGYPRFKSRRRFDSYTFPRYGDGCRLKDARLYLQGVGHMKVKLHRPVDGLIKTVTVKRECGKWAVCFSVEVEPTPLPEADTATGIDVGLTALATLADGTVIANPRCYQRAQAKLRVAQRRVARRKRGGKNAAKPSCCCKKRMSTSRTSGRIFSIKSPGGWSMPTASSRLRICTSKDWPVVCWRSPSMMLAGRRSSRNWSTKRQKLVDSWCTSILVARARAVSVAQPSRRH